MHRRVLVAIAALSSLGLVAVMSVPVLMLLATTTGTTGSDTQTISCDTDLPAGNPVVLTDDDQRANAKTIIQVGVGLKVPTRGLIVAIATAMQESKLHNLTYGDRDSVGLFQQRDAWGTFAQRTDPGQSAAMFYTGGHAGQRGLLDITGWQDMTVTGAAQAVQVSGFPLAYAQWESLATSTVQQVTAGVEDCQTDQQRAGLPDGAVGEMLTAALAQQGDPYVWGAVGPDAFDCSGLVVWSWGQAGYRLKIRTAAQMWDNSTPVPAEDAQPGDLLFSHFGDGSVGHVEIVVRKGTVVEAPHAGDVVKVRDYRMVGDARIGRLKTSAMVKVG